jgi:hypothetical protein
MHQLVYKRLKTIFHSGIFGFGLCFLTILYFYNLTDKLPDPKISFLPSTEQIEMYARLFLNDGVKAREGKRLDCSGYTREVFRTFSIQLPSSAAEQLRFSNRLEMKELKKGDLVFFRTAGKSISHVGIYLDNSQFIHSPGRNQNVRIDHLVNKYWLNAFVCGGRIKIFYEL